MRIILSVLITLGFLTLFFRGDLGIIGLLLGAVIIWNLIGSIFEYKRR